MKKGFQKINQLLNELALNTVMLDPGDIPGLGNVLTSLEDIQKLISKLSSPDLAEIVQTLKEHIESVIMGDSADLTPLEKGISEMQDLCRKLEGGQPIGKKKKTVAKKTKAKRSAAKSTPQKTSPPPEPKPTPAAQTAVSDEDKEIVIDFVAESLENLGSIEVSLMDLEQDPSDIETINAIFRPFHTVKGVSGFLNFNKINRLAHMAENFLDKARNGEIVIDGEIVDLILDCVDQLKNMIENVQASLDSGTPQEGEVDIEPMIDRINQVIEGYESGGDKPLGEVLLAKEALSETDLNEALDIQKEEKEQKIGEILVKEKKVPTREVVTALRDQKKFARRAELQVKVDTLKLDNVVDMVGELAIAQSMLRQNEQIRTINDRKLYQITNQLNLITSTLQKTVMSLRMVPIKNTFQKMLRLVRDLAKKNGKEVRLEMSGQDTEIDRNMVEEIYEPMVHMIRNSIDHGLEKPDAREAVGKASQGTIWLKAYHKGGDIVIEIGDDGKGLDREKIMAKALKVGLAGEDDKLTPAEIDNLIFHPGFSTADKVTDISGRGVGTDVVKSKIEKLRGRVEVVCNPGQGTTFFMRLPLTLAIVDGMIVKIDGRRFIIPTLNVQESFKPKPEHYFTVKGQGEMIKVRENLLPLMRLDEIFGRNGGRKHKDDKIKPWEKLVVVVENQERRKCLLIDELIGQEEVVIKSLGGWLTNISGIAGGAILGDGTVGLILDMAGIFDIALGE
jgi:two-component system chemotaxis sensor kinase CheA